MQTDERLAWSEYIGGTGWLMRTNPWHARAEGGENYTAISKVLLDL
jgi:hypothetical protein